MLLHRKVDHTMLHSSAPCLPTLAAFVELLRIRCLSIWDQLEAASETATLTLPSKDAHHHPHYHHQWKTTPSNGLVTLLAAHPVDERRLEETVSAKLTSDLQAKLKRYQLKQQQQLKKKKGRWGKKDGRLHSPPPPPPTSIPLKRLLHPESKTMATVLRKEAKLHGRPIGRETLTRLAKQVGVDDIDGPSGHQQQQQQQQLLLPATWSRRSLRHLPSQFQIPVIKEFSSLYAQLVAAIESYRFGDWAEG